MNVPRITEQQVTTLLGQMPNGKLTEVYRELQETNPILLKCLEARVARLQQKHGESAGLSAFSLALLTYYLIRQSDGVDYTRDTIVERGI